jgi:hypothetical protein
MTSAAEICPDYVGDRRISLSLRATGDIQEIPRVGQLVDLVAAYDDAEEGGGIVLPLELVISGPTLAGRQIRLYRRFAPTTIVFIPRERGRHVVTLRERYHNRWFGSLEVIVL